MAVYVRNIVTRVYMHIKGSPFSVQVDAGKTIPSNCIASGGGLFGTSLRQKGQVIITTRDAWNNERLGLNDEPANVMLALQGMSYLFGVERKIILFSLAIKIQFRKSNQLHQVIPYHCVTQVPNQLQLSGAMIGLLWVDMLAHTVDVLDVESIPSLTKPANRCLLNLAACMLAVYVLVMQIATVNQVKAFCTSLWRTFMSKEVHFWSRLS